MSQWWERPGVQFHPRAACWDCEAPLFGTPLVIPIHHSTYRGQPITYAAQVCARCFFWNALTNEANELGARFTTLDRDPCVCGLPKPDSLRTCVKCRRESRMLDRRLADVKRTRRILTQLRREIADVG